MGPCHLVTQLPVLPDEPRPPQEGEKTPPPPPQDTQREAEQQQAQRERPSPSLSRPVKPHSQVS